MTSSFENKRAELPQTARTLAARYYTDESQYRLELERFHFSMWLYAGHLDQLAEAGDYFLVELAEESVIVVRDANGDIGAFHNVCRHRGTRLCTEESGRFKGGRIQCGYHAWTYGLDGCLKRAPFMDKTDGFRAEDNALGPLAVDTWDGHVFINFSDRPAPLSDQLGDLETRFRAWRMQDLRLGAEKVYHLRANWKLIIHNYSECVHCPLLHPQLNRVSHFMSGENDPPSEHSLGGRMELRDGFETQTMTGSSPWQPLPGLDAEQRRGVYYWAVLPNLLLNLHPDYMLTFSLLPKAVDRTDIVCRWYFHPDEMARDEFDPKPAVEFWHLTNQQDWEITESAQLGIASRGYRPGPYSNREELLWALDRIVRERTS